MDGYRSGARCEFCDEIADGFCPRCQCHVCPSHGLDEHAHCAMCRKEARDDEDVRRFRGDILTLETEDLPYTRREMGVIEVALGAIGRLIFQPSAAARGKHAFAQRTPDEIFVWRREAGVPVRTRHTS